MEQLGNEIARLEKTLAAPNFYAKDPAGFQQASDRLTAAQAELESGEERWLELEERRESLASG